MITTSKKIAPPTDPLLLTLSMMRPSWITGGALLYVGSM
jgi:hypothetical protein